jgi:hypothetical protein
MSNYEDAPQAQGHPSKGSAFVLLPGMEGQGYEPYQMSHSHFTLEQVDRTMVDLMRSWVRTHPLDMGICLSDSQQAHGKLVLQFKISS